MLFHDFLQALWWSFLLIAPITLISLIGSSAKEVTVLAGAAIWAILTIAGGWWFWKYTPVTGLTKVAIYHNFWTWWWLILVVVALVGFAASSEGESPTIGTVILGVLVAIGLVYGIAVQSVWNNGRAKQLAHEIHVVNQKANTYPDTDPNHILQVPEQTADFKANQVLASSRQHNLGTIYNVGKGTQQTVDNHLYWIYGLEPTGYRNSNREPGGNVPGFIVVDAEDPNPPAQLRLKDRFGNPIQIKYYLGGYHGHKLERYYWGHGYHNQLVTDSTLEVNDDWQPYYTASLDRVSVGFQKEVPGKILLVNPQSGKIVSYAIGKEPGWVDRIYSKGTVKQLLNWWGEWDQAKYNLINESSANRYKVAPNEDPVLVYTKGGHPVWQAIMTSYNKDTSAAYLALFDARDNKVRMYQIQGLTLANTAAETILGSGSNLKKLQPVHLSLHKIYGVLTWVAPLIKPQDDSGSSSAYQGIALLRADDLNGGSVVISGNKADALTQYRERLATGDNNAAPDQNSQTKSASGAIARVSQVVEGGQTVFYFTLVGDTTHVYRAGAGRNGSGDQNLELPFIKRGTRVRMTYLDTGGSRRDVGAYDDLTLQVSSTG